MWASYRVIPCPQGPTGATLKTSRLSSLAGQADRSAIRTADLSRLPDEAGTCLQVAWTKWRPGEIQCALLALNFLRRDSQTLSLTQCVTKFVHAHGRRYRATDRRQQHSLRGLVDSLPHQPCPQGPQARHDHAKTSLLGSFARGNVRPLRRGKVSRRRKRLLDTVRNPRVTLAAGEAAHRQVHPSSIILQPTQRSV